MATDYHIYLHGNLTSSNRNKTVPFKQGSESPFLTQVQNFFNQDEYAETGASSLMPITTALAVSVAAYKGIEKILTTGFAHLTEYTGHYEYEIQLNNFKTAINHITHPIGYAKQIIHRNAQWNKQNLQVAEERILIGDTLYKNQKIGV